MASYPRNPCLLLTPTTFLFIFLYLICTDTIASLMTQASHPSRSTAPQTSPFLTAVQGKVPARTPFWLMRQAGRYLPEYRAVRQQAGGFLTMCYTPELACEVTLQPIRRFDMDAAIIFSDILVIPHALGQDLRFAEGEGPRLPPISDHHGVAALDAARVNDHLQPVYQALRLTRQALPADKALIGFIGAPWTVACYMVDGRGGDFPLARAMAANNPDLFQQIIDQVTAASITYLLGQIAAGADCVQIFDSWAGLAGAEGFERWVIQPTQKIVAAVHAAYPGFPVIGFPRGCATQAAHYAAATGVQAVGIDQHADMAAAVASVPDNICLQGNLDPEILLAGGDDMRRAITHILSVCQNRPHIFNLGHGIIKETPPEHVAELAALIRG